MPHDAVIETRDLTRSFGRVRALDGVDLTVRSGEVHGFLGPNGAGKSTTIRILLGLLRASGGTATVLGRDPWRDAVTLHRRMAYVPGDVALWPNLTGGETIDILGAARGELDRGRRDDLVERFELDPTRRCGAYSKGNRQKVALVAALASDAELLVLDEPTSGLDPLMEAVFVECIEAERAAGRTVLLSSHTLAQVERLCDRVSIIRQGRIVDSGTLDELRHLTRTTIRARTRTPVDLAALPGVYDVRTDTGTGTGTEGEVTADVDPDALDAVIGALHEAGIVSLVSHPPTLEQLFLRHYANDAAGQARR